MVAHDGVVIISFHAANDIFISMTPSQCKSLLHFTTTDMLAES